MSKTTLMDNAQPFLRDRYANMRDGYASARDGYARNVAPQLAHTRDVAVPIALDMSHKAADLTTRMRNDVLPMATKRAALAAAALRGAELERQRERGKWRLIAAASAAGAALGAGAYMWQRKRAQECWCEECVEEQAAADAGSPAED